MRVLHVTQPTVAGVPTVVRQLAQDQMEHGFDVVVAAPADGDLTAWLASDGVRHVAWTASRNPGRSIAAEALELRRIVASVVPDVVHLHSAKAGLAGRLVLRRRLPTVFQPHAWSFEAVTGPAAVAARQWERGASRWTDLLLCVSEDERATAEAAGVRGRFVVLPNGIDVSAFSLAGSDERDAARVELGLPTGPLVVCVGRLTRQKGQDTLLAALHILRAEVPDATVALVGDGPDAELLRASAPADVVFAGHRPDIVPWLRAADVVALPSRWEAGGSLAAFEAMAVGRSVVSTAVAGAGPLLEGAGAVVPVDDSAALAAALIVRLQSPTLAAAEGLVGRANVVREHDVGTTAARVRRCYAELVNRDGINLKEARTAA